MRIVSLLASATEIVDLIGATEDLVGISHECDFPPSVLDLPRLSRTRFDPTRLDSTEVDAAVRQAMADYGSVYEVDAKRLAALKPDLVLTQAVCEVCAVPTAGVREVVANTGLATRVLSLDAHSLEDIVEAVEEVGLATRREDAAARAATGLRARIEQVRQRAAGLEKPRVLAIEWLSPPFTPGHWVPEMIAVCGGSNLVGDPRRRSRQVEWADLAGLDPDVLIVMPCGYDLQAAAEDADSHAEALSNVADRAIRSGRAYVVDASSYFNRSGPRVVTGIEILAGILHPEAFGAPDPSVARTWSPGDP